LLDEAPAMAAARLAARYPAVVRRNLFVEYELGPDRTPSGFGLGLPWGQYDSWISRDHGFLKTPIGRAVAAAMADDPFMDDNALYLNLFSDDDPDWIEYDIDGGVLGEAPFVFFRPPSRLRALTRPDQVRTLCGLIPGAPPGGDFAVLLDILLKHGPAGLYRVGRSRRRGEGWWRAIVTELDHAQVAAVLRRFGAADYEAPLDLATAFYEGRADRPGARFALSIDVTGAAVTALDVECPYLMRIGEPQARIEPLTELLAGLTRLGTLSPAMAAWLGAQVSRDVTAPDLAKGLRVQLRHLKHRFLGAPHLRAKAYVHLQLAPAAALAEAP
jgi:hypothetical protein